MGRLRRLPREAWVAGAFVLGIVIGLSVTWLALGILTVSGTHRQVGPDPAVRPHTHAPYRPGGGYR